MYLHIEREPGQRSAQPQKGLQWRLPVAGGSGGASGFAPPPRGQESRESVGTAVRLVYLALCADGARAAMLSVPPDLLLWSRSRLQSQAPAAPEGGFGSASAPGADWRLEGTADGLGAGMRAVQ